MEKEEPSPIVQVIQHYHPEWKPPPNRREWVKTLCPFHHESNPSATVSYEHNAFKCFGCGVKGGVVSLIRQQEGVSYAQAVRKSEEILVGCVLPVSGSATRKPGRRVFGESGTDTRGGSAVRPGIRRRSSPWT